jgi:hypothetical protein
LDQLREEEDQIDELVRGLISHTSIYSGSTMARGIDRWAIARVPRSELFGTARRIITNPTDEKQGQIQPNLKAAVDRLDALPGDQQRLMRALKVFLIRTLTILVLAIIGLIFVEQLKAWQGPLG